MRRTPTGGISTRCYGMDKLDSVLSAVRHAPDTYLSQASFIAPSRRVQHLQSIRAAWVDIDCYTIGATPTDAFISEVLDLARQMGLPHPSYVVQSGRGLYVKWIFDDAIGAADLQQWTELQRTLVAIYRAIGADAKSRDAARVLRALGTINSKVSPEGSRYGDVRSGEVHCCWNSGQIVSFMELCAHAAAAKFVGLLSDRRIDDGGINRAAYDSDDTYAIPSDEEANATTAEVIQRRLKRSQDRLARSMAETHRGASNTDLPQLDLYAKVREPIMLQRQSSQHLNWKRFADLRNLAISRGGVPQGWRDEYLFWMANSLAHAQVLTPRNFWDEVEQLALIIEPDKRTFDPKRDGSMSTLFRRLCVERHTERTCSKTGLYRPTNEHLIELFGIGPEEQQHLSTLISAAERDRRKLQANPQRAARREGRQQRDTLIVQALQAGQDVSQISQSLGITRQAVYRVRDKMQAASALQVNSNQAADEFSAPKATHSNASAPSSTTAARRKAVELKGGLLNQISDLYGIKTEREIALQLQIPRSAVQRALRQMRRLHVVPPTPHPDHCAAGKQGTSAAEDLTPHDPMAAGQAEVREELIVELRAAQAQAAQLAAQAEVARSRLAAANAAASLMEKVVEKVAHRKTDSAPEESSAPDGQCVDASTSRTSLRDKADQAKENAALAREHCEAARQERDAAHKAVERLLSQMMPNPKVRECRPEPAVGDILPDRIHAAIKDCHRVPVLNDISSAAMGDCDSAISPMMHAAHCRASDPISCISSPSHGADRQQPRGEPSTWRIKPGQSTAEASASTGRQETSLYGDKGRKRGSTISGLQANAGRTLDGSPSACSETFRSVGASVEHSTEHAGCSPPG